jgi:hypothetical protein
MLKFHDGQQVFFNFMGNRMRGVIRESIQIDNQYGNFYNIMVNTEYKRYLQQSFNQNLAQMPEAEIYLHP